MMSFVFRSIDDVDGLCAVARTPHLICRLTKYEQKCNWQQSLTLHDLALSQNIQRTPLEEHKLHMGLATSLRQLGWTSLLRTRLSTLKQTSVWQDEFSDMESELMWRLSDWESPEVCGLRAPSSDMAGFNSALHSALCNLKEGHQSALLESIATCRSDVVQRMALSATESLAAVNPALVKLQMVDMICEAWGLKWSSEGSRVVSSILISSSLGSSHSLCLVFQLLLLLILTTELALSCRQPQKPASTVANSSYF